MPAELTDRNPASVVIPFRARKGKLSEWGDGLVEPAGPSQAEPGTSEKVVTLAARYAAGLPLWHDDDRDGHHPLDDDEDF
ncbi:MAG: hypothetical protein WD066_17750 [Planctomycetaceae bacterium]